MRRRLFNFAALISLMLGIAAVVEWPVSNRHGAFLWLPLGREHSAAFVFDREIFSVGFVSDPDWTGPLDWGTQKVSQRSLLEELPYHFAGFGIGRAQHCSVLCVPLWLVALTWLCVAFAFARRAGCRSQQKQRQPHDSPHVQRHDNTFAAGGAAAGRVDRMGKATTGPMGVGTKPHTSVRRTESGSGVLGANQHVAARQ